MVDEKSAQRKPEASAATYQPAPREARLFEMAKLIMAGMCSDKAILDEHGSWRAVAVEAVVAAEALLDEIERRPWRSK